MVITHIGGCHRKTQQWICHKKTYRNIIIFAEKMRLIVNVSICVYSVNSHQVLMAMTILAMYHFFLKVVLKDRSYHFYIRNVETKA